MVDASEVVSVLLCRCELRYAHGICADRTMRTRLHPKQSPYLGRRQLHERPPLAVVVVMARLGILPGFAIAALARINGVTIPDTPNRWNLVSCRGRHDDGWRFGILGYSSAHAVFRQKDRFSRQTRHCTQGKPVSPAPTTFVLHARQVATPRSCKAALFAAEIDRGTTED